MNDDNRLAGWYRPVRLIGRGRRSARETEVCEDGMERGRAPAEADRVGRELAAFAVVRP